MTRTKSLSLALGLALSLPVAAAAAETGAFLKLSPGPRPMALGDAYTAVVDDLNAQALNPAGLARLSSRELGFSHAELYSDTRLDALGYAHPLKGGSALAAGLTRLSHGAIAGRDPEGRPTGSFSASDTAAQLAYGRRFAGLGLAGVNLKYLESRLAYATARGVAADFGLLRARGAWSWGAAVRNVGRGLRFEDRTDELPLTLAAGAALRVAGSLLVSAQVAHRPRSPGVTAGLGTEYGVLPSLVLRGGYRAGRDGSDGRPGAAFSAAGLGMGLGIRLKRAGFDYAFSPQGELGQVHRLGVATRF